MFNKLELRDKCRENFNKYLRKVIRSFPRIEVPKILDLGCGTGVSTIELAKITNGQIIAVDLDEDSLEWLQHKIYKHKLEKRISVIHKSVSALNFDNNYFDIILAEGIFNIIGFDKGLSRFSKFLKTGAYFIVHDEMGNREKKLKIIEQHNLTLVNSIILDEKVWWEEYYKCLQQNISYLKTMKGINIEKKLKQEISEIEMCKSNPGKFRSMYYILKRTK